MVGSTCERSNRKARSGPPQMPEASPACSRWLSEATPPVYGRPNAQHPGRGASQPLRAMPSTHTCLLYHLVFATKNREPLLSQDWRDRLHEYLGGIVRGLGGVPQGVGGVADHVHLLVGLKATHCLSDFMRDLKETHRNGLRTQRVSLDFIGRRGMPRSRSAPRQSRRFVNTSHGRRSIIVTRPFARNSSSSCKNREWSMMRDIWTDEREMMP